MGALLPPPRRGSRPAAPARWQRRRRAPAAVTVTQLHRCPRGTAGSQRRRRSAASGSARSSSLPGANSSANLPRPGRGIPPPPPGAACSHAGDAARQCPPLARRPSALCPPAAAPPRAATARGEAEGLPRSESSALAFSFTGGFGTPQSREGGSDTVARKHRGIAKGAAALLGQERSSPGKPGPTGPEQAARAGLLWQGILVWQGIPLW